MNRNAYLVQAIHIATDIENAAALAAFKQRLSYPSRATEILAQNERNANTLHYLAGAYGVDLNDEPTGDLAASKIGLRRSLDAYLNSDATRADEAFEKVLSDVVAFRGQFTALADDRNISAALKGILG